MACFSILRRVAKPLKEDLLLPLERHRYILYIVQNFYFPIHGMDHFDGEVSFVSDSIQVLYMSFDRFLLAVESRDLSQADKSILFQFYKTLIFE